MKNRRNLYTVLLISFICTTGTAQEIHSDSTDVFYKHLEINELVVTGLAGETKMKEMASPVSVIRPADLAARAGTNIINIIASEPGVNEICYPWYGIQPGRRSE